jgi:multidrug efflux pump subunit AcrA (membrane-fusion protein)
MSAVLLEPTQPESPDRKELDLDAALPRRRQDLVVRPASQEGWFVVKAPATGSYFQIGLAEHFLLGQLDGNRTAGVVREAFEKHFGEPLTASDLDDFLKMAASMELLEVAEGSAPLAPPSRKKTPQNFLYFRKNLFDPNAFFNWLAPKISIVWTRGFVASSVALFVLAFLIAWTNRTELFSRFNSMFDWQVLALFWVTVVVTMVLHEFAHGLTCKHFGGEVREVGVLVMFFTPCLYCNVSDAWLFPEKWKRIWVGIAGPYLDLCLWAVAVFVWRVTVQDSALNYVSWTVMATCASRTILNFNPLMKSDGYYLLSDWMQIPNLSNYSLQRWGATARWLLWGAPRPERIPQGKFIVGYGFLSWAFILLFLGMMIPSLLKLPKDFAGVFGFLLSLLIIPLMCLVAFHGILTKEVITMIKTRKLRRTLWLVALAGIAVALAIVPFSDRATGTFQVRPRTRVEIRALEAGFLRQVSVDEGSELEPGALIAQIEIPDLEMSLRKKQAELKETQARLKMLEAGPRREEIEEQRQRVVRYERWCDLAKQNLEQAREALAQDLIRLDRQIKQYEAEVTYARRICEQSKMLFEKGAFASEQLIAEEKKELIAEFQLDQAKAQKQAREATGTIEFEGELARREKDLSDVRSTLALLEIGTRPEEVEAERAKLERLQEDWTYLEAMHERVVVKTPVAGVVITPRVKEKIGQYIEKGALICVVEDTSTLEAEITLPEDEAAGVEEGQTVQLKARALPFKKFKTVVDRKAPRAVVAENKVQGTVTVYCHLSESDQELLPGMTGFARINRSRQPMGWVLGVHSLKMLRTEFWW